MLADSAFYLLDVPGVRRFAEQALQLAEQVQRSDLAADALGWVVRRDQADGDLAQAMQTDRAAEGAVAALKQLAMDHGPLTLTGWRDGRCGDGRTARRRTRADVRRYRVRHLRALPLLVARRGGEVSQGKGDFEEVRRFGRRYGILPPLARAIAMQAGMHLAVYDLDGAETLQHEALELARSLAFTPTIVSASIDLSSRWRAPRSRKRG